MKRREFVAALASAATVAPVCSRKGAAAKDRSPILRPPRTQHLITAFQQRLTRSRLC